MAFTLNKIMLIGMLGKDAEHRFTTSNVAVSSFSIATENSYKGKDGNWVNETTWHNIVAFSLSDYMKEQLKKGKKFYVEGRLTKRDYTDKENIKRYATEVFCEKLIPLDSKGGMGQQADYSSGMNKYDNVSTGSSEPEAPGPDENDDLPF